MYLIEEMGVTGCEPNGFGIFVKGLALTSSFFAMLFLLEKPLLESN